MESAPATNSTVSGIPKVSGEFVARMEDVLCTTKYDPERPVVCFDETSKHRGCAASQGRSRTDGALCEWGEPMFCEPKGGCRGDRAPHCRTSRTEWLVDQANSGSADNLNTHKSRLRGRVGNPPVEAGTWLKC